MHVNIFILDKNLKVSHTLSSKGDGVNSSPFFNDEYVQYLETGAETFEFNTLQHESIDIGNYVAFTYNGECKLFQISEIEEEHNENFGVKVYCEVAGLELTYEILRPREIPSANIKQYLQNVLSETDWEVGYVDDDIQLVHTINIEDYVEVYNHIQETILKYECEISFRVVRNGSRITHKYIDVYKQRGTESRFRFDYHFNMSNVKRTKKSDTLATALIGVGKDNVNFKTVEWKKSEGDPCDKPLGQDFIGDITAFNRWNTNGKHLMGRFKCDSESPQELLRLTWNSLQERKNPKMEYSMDVSLLTDEEVFIGDEVYVIDNEFMPSLWLSARVNELHLSFTDKTKNTCSFCNYKEIKSKIKNDSLSLLKQINNNMFMGVAKGGFLNSNLVVNNFDINVKNKMVDENGKEYFFDVRNKKATTFVDDIANTSVKVTQSFAIDFVNNHIYATQVEDDNTTGNIILSKIDFNGKVLGKMYLKAFGHGNQIGIDRVDGVTKIWIECDGAIASGGSFFGKKVCRFEFINNKTCYNHEGNVYSLAPSDSEYVFVAVNEESDRLGIRYKQNGKFYFEVYSLRSVLNNTPQLLAKILKPSTIETSSKSPNQGFALYANMIYNYEGFSYDQTDNKNNIKISCIDFRGTVLYSQYITHAPNLSYREPEGLFFRQVDETIFELYFGITSGAAGSRKFNIYKFTDSAGENYEKRGSFLHNNGHTNVIEEGVIRTGYIGETRKNAYLLYINKKDRFIYEGDTSRQFIVAEFRNGKWYHHEKEFEIDINDAIVGEIQEKKEGVSLVLFTQDFNAIKGEDGQDGLPGQDAFFLELTNEHHSVPTDANGNNGVYSGCETSLNLYRGDTQLTENVTYGIKSISNVTGELEGNKYSVTNLSKDTGYVDLVAAYLGKEYTKRFSINKNKQGLGGEDGLTPTVYWLMTSTSTISKDSKGNLKPSSVTFWAKSQTGEDSVVNYQGIFKIYESIDGNVFTLKHTSELDDTVPYTPSSTAQSIKCELYLNDGVTLIDQDIINIVKDGTDGFSGVDAKYVLLTGEQLFKYSNNFTGKPTPETITLTGTPFNISSTNSKWYYKQSSDSDYTLIPSNNGRMDLTINHDDNILFANGNKVVTIKFDIDGHYDEMTVAKISDGRPGTDGSDGEDGYFVLLTNENHSIPCENNGDVIDSELEKAKTEIHVYKGAKEVPFTLSKVDSGCTSVYNAANKTISITSLTSKSATVALNIRVDNVNFTKVMSISKAIKGDTGAGVNIIGSLNSESELPNFGNMGDAYIIGGFLYVWSGNTNTWENVGQIKGDQGIAGKPGVDGITYYTWVKYADDEIGTGMSDDPVDSNGIYKKYMGMAYNKETQQESSNPEDYTWIKVVGEDGHDSIIANLTNDAHTVPTDSNGTNGNYLGCSTQIELFIGTEKITSGVTYSFSPISGITGNGNTSNGTYTVTNMTVDVGYVDLTAKYNNKNFVKRFTVSKNKQGQAGTNGTNGIDGRPGQDGITYYTWIKYSNNANGNPMTDDPNSKYIGIAYNKPSIIEGTNPQDYTWTLIKGADGQDGTDGQDGVPGAPGEDGITYYTWIKYSDYADGSNMTDNPDSKYIGIAYNKLEKTESTNPKDYSWTLIKGEDGKDAYTINLTNDNHSFGCDAGGNIETVITTTTSVSAYKGTNLIAATIGSLPTVAGLTLSKSGATITIQANVGKLLADNGSFNIPITVDGHSFTKSFSWVKTKKGINGTDGANGSDGVSIKTVDVEYAQNTSSSTAPTSGWTTTAPIWSNGKYIWSRTKTVLSDGTVKYTNPACITGQQGQNGTNGVGISSIVEYYKVHTSNTGVTNATSGFTTTVPTMTETNKYLWNYELITYTNNTTEKTTARVIGMYSKDGTNGTNGSDGKGIKSIVNYYLASASSSGVTTSTSGWTTTIQTVSTSKKYLWNYEVINYTTGSPTTTSPAIIGVYGDTGATGTGITSITEEFYLSTSKTTQIGGSWVTTPPTWSVGKYMWTRSKIVYSNPTSTVYTTPVCDSSWEAVNEIEIGGRNYLLGTGKSVSITGSNSENQCIDLYYISDADALVNKSTKLRFKCVITNYSGGTFDIQTHPNMWWAYIYHYQPTGNGTFEVEGNLDFGEEVTFDRLQLRLDNFIGTVEIKEMILSMGSHIADWTPAPEDVNDAIGENIKSVDVMYYLSTSQTSLAGGSWQTTAPTWVNGKYMWSKTVTTLANGTVKESSPTCIAGAKGDTGSAGKGVKSIVEQYYLSTSQTVLSGGSWSTTVPTWQQGKYIWTRSIITYTDNTTTTTNGICVSGSKGDKGDAGTNGTNGTSPVLVTISGQQSMKYLDKTTAPIPSIITLTANVMEGSSVVTSGITYIWQYKNSNGSWVNLSGTYTDKTYSLAHNNTGFIDEVAQVRVAVSYKSQTYYLEHTVTKIYDNKYITHQEVFDKLTENGKQQLIYKDPQTGEMYINATYIKSGQLVADLIRGGVLTLGGAIGTDDNPINGYMRVLGADNQELAVLNGGEMTINGFSSDEATIDSLFVQDIKSPKIPPAVTENTTIYVNQTTGNDDVEFDNGAVYKTVQGAIDATPKNLNGFDVYIRLQGTSSGGISTYNENLTYKGFYGGSLYTYLQKNYVHGYIVMRDCSARLSLVGGSNYDEIPDDADAYERANIKPASLYSTGNTYYTICAINCTDVYIRALDLWGSTATNSNGYPNYAVGVREGSNVFVRNVKIHSSTNGFHAQVMGRLFTVNTHGKVTNYAYRCTYGGWMNIGSGTSVSGGSSSLNISTGDGCQILQGNITWDGSSSTGTNDNTTVNSSTTTYSATSGDSYKVKYSSWRKDNTVRQGDWSGTGMHKGCWFFGSQFNDVKGKTIKSVKLTIQRQSSGGNSGAVAFTLKMHNHTGRPSGAPSYLSGWSKNVSLSLGQSSTITITDSAVLTAIKNGTMKGFGVEISSTSNSYYGILSPKLKAVVTYS